MAKPSERKTNGVSDAQLILERDARAELAHRSQQHHHDFVASLKTFANLSSQRKIVGLATYIDGQAFIVATENDLFEADIIKKRVTLFKFWADDKKEKLGTFGELVAEPIVAMTVLHQSHTVFVATAIDVFQVNFVTKRVSTLNFWPAVDFVPGDIPAA
jgi:hypothetical protein